MKPDSLLNAAKKMATAFEMPWPSMQKTYRALQEKDEFLTSWLPKSQGRQIWFAHPNFAVRLLLAVGFSGGKVNAHQANYLGYALTENGRKLHLNERPSLEGTEFLSILAAHLVDPAKAAAIHEIEFDSGNKTVSVRYCNEPDQVFQPSGSHEFGLDDDLFENGIAAAMDADTSSPINSKLSISGKAIQEIAATVNWRDQSNPPFSLNAKSGMGEAD